MSVRIEASDAERFVVALDGDNRIASAVDRHGCASVVVWARRNEFAALKIDRKLVGFPVRMRKCLAAVRGSGIGMEFAPPVFVRTGDVVRPTPDHMHRVGIVEPEPDVIGPPAWIGAE